MKRNFLAIFIASMFVMSCETKKQEAATTETETEVVLDEHNAQNSLDILGTYKGVLPCASCEGIETEIILNSDETYTKKSKYLGEASENVFEEMGSYSWKDGNTLILEGIHPDEISQYRVAENMLIQLDMEGNEITGTLAENYILKK